MPNWINIVHVPGGLLEQVKPPYPFPDLNLDTIITVKGKNYRVAAVVGNLQTGPAEIRVKG